MIRKLVDSLTSRRVSIALMIFVVVVGAIGAWVPQRFNMPQSTFGEWSADNPSQAAIYEALGFDRIFTMWWFRGLAAIFLVSISIATWRMFVTAWRRIHAQALPPVNTVSTATADEIAARARAAGFLKYSSVGGVQNFWRHRAGVWAPAIMHAGMVVAMMAAIAASAFTTRGVVDLSAGEVFSPGDEYLAVEGGVLDALPDLDTPIRLDELTTQEWPDGELRNVTAHLSLLDEAREWKPYEGSPNDPLHFRSHTIYIQPGEFGDAAFVMVTSPDGAREGHRLEFTYVARGTAGYTSIRLPDGKQFDGRWDPHHVRNDKLLAVRVDSDESSEPVTMNVGESATIDGYEFEFLKAGQWARLIIVRPYATEILFIGFAIIGVGSLMLYAWIPRQLVVAAGPDGTTRYSWRVSRMAKAYESERDTIIGITQGGDA